MNINLICLWIQRDFLIKKDSDWSESSLCSSRLGERDKVTIDQASILFK